jgi:hypothetical protein
LNVTSDAPGGDDKAHDSDAANCRWPAASLPIDLERLRHRLQSSLRMERAGTLGGSPFLRKR